MKLIYQDVNSCILFVKINKGTTFHIVRDFFYVKTIDEQKSNLDEKRVIFIHNMARKKVLNVDFDLNRSIFFSFKKIIWYNRKDVDCVCAKEKKMYNVLIVSPFAIYFYCV